MQTYEILESEFSQWCGKKHAISVNSGTSALHLALLALGIKEGDEVIVPDFTFVACAFAVTYIGAKPIFVDCDDTYNIDVSKIEEKITPKTKAIMAVHVYGRRSNMNAICRIATQHNLHILEDMSEAHGIHPIGDIAIYSFQSSKIIHAEEGGMIVTNRENWASEMRLRKTLSNDGLYNHSILGFNYRMPNAQAELALKSFREFDKEIKKRRIIEEAYSQAFAPGIYRQVPWVFDVQVPTKELRDRILKYVKGTRCFFKPMSSLPMYDQEVGKNALKFSETGLVIPINDDFERYINEVGQWSNVFC